MMNATSCRTGEYLSLKKREKCEAHVFLYEFLAAIPVKNLNPKHYHLIGDNSIPINFL